VKAVFIGVSKDDTDIRIDGNLVTIAAEVKQEKEEKKEGRVLRSERQYGLCQPQLHARQRGGRRQGRGAARERRAGADAAEEGGGLVQAAGGEVTVSRHLARR
jgi:hypothetical protein